MSTVTLGKKSQIPNTLTVLRLLIAFIFPLLHWPLRLIAFFTAMLTECLDGFLARRWNATSLFGQMMDPAADKAFALSVGLTFVFARQLTVLQLAAVLTRDIVVALTSLWVLGFGPPGLLREFTPHWSGKLATAVQYLLFLSLFLAVRVQPYILTATIGLSVLAGVAYTLKFIDLVRTRQR